MSIVHSFEAKNRTFYIDSSIAKDKHVKVLSMFEKYSVQSAIKQIQ